MDKHKIGFLHPGAMGISLAATASNSGFEACWVSAGRSPATQARAAEHDLSDAGSLQTLCETCTVIVSICPPHAAEAVAAEVMAAGFQGIYVDANAIAPQRAERIAALIQSGGASYVDGGVIGGPAWKPHSTWLYLSGPQAAQVAAYFAAGPLETQLCGDALGRASAIKMCYAAYTKGSTALLCAVLGAAEGLGVRAELEQQWSRDGSDFTAQAHNRARRVTAKAWRFAGEMEEIAATFASTGIPGEFHQGAAELYRRLAGFKEQSESPELAAVLAALLNA